MSILARIAGRIVHMWKTPSAFRDDWRAYARNQLGHVAAVGLVPALLLGPVGAAIILVLFALWELTQWQFRRAEASDGLEDWGFVCGGAVLGVTGQPGHAFVIAAFLAAGIVSRIGKGDGA